MNHRMHTAIKKMRPDQTKNLKVTDSAQVRRVKKFYLINFVRNSHFFLEQLLSGMGEISKLLLFTKKGRICFLQKQIGQ